MSTATFLRFVKKIGFAGFSEFTTVLKYTLLNDDQDTESDMPFTVSQTDYREEYLKNITESVRVVPTSKLHEITKLLSAHPKIYFFLLRVSVSTPRITFTIYLSWQVFRWNFRVNIRIGALSASSAT